MENEAGYLAWARVEAVSEVPTAWVSRLWQSWALRTVSEVEGAAGLQGLWVLPLVREYQRVFSSGGDLVRFC